MVALPEQIQLNQQKMMAMRQRSDAYLQAAKADLLEDKDPRANLQMAIEYMTQSMELDIRVTEDGLNFYKGYYNGDDA